MIVTKLYMPARRVCSKVDFVNHARKEAPAMTREMLLLSRQLYRVKLNKRLPAPELRLG
jgi:hypothetical protein